MQPPYRPIYCIWPHWIFGLRSKLIFFDRKQTAGIFHIIHKINQLFHLSFAIKVDQNSFRTKVTCSSSLTVASPKKELYLELSLFLLFFSIILSYFLLTSLETCSTLLFSSWPKISVTIFGSFLAVLFRVQYPADLFKHSMLYRLINRQVGARIPLFLQVFRP